MTDDRPDKMLALVLTADAGLPDAAWADLVSLATPPENPPDPAPGQEFAPAESPPAVREALMERVRAIAADNPRRTAERAENPLLPDEQRRKAAALAADIRRVVSELPGIGSALQPELEDAVVPGRAE